MASLFEGFTRRRVPRPAALFSITQILEWADAHHSATGRWPSTSSGRIRQSRFGASWKAIDLALRKGLQGAPALSLAILLHERRGKKLRVDVEKERSPAETRRNRRAAHVGDREKLSVERILAWADAHHAATGRWPTNNSGPIPGVPGDNWRTIADALREGRRGLPGGTTLAGLLLQHRGRLARNRAPDLTVKQILRWADDYYKTRGCWPSERRGKVAGVPGETWPAIDRRLRQGGRGLSGGSSLPRLLAEHRGVRKPSSVPDLSIAQVLTWADAHHKATGKWPHCNDGAVRGVPSESWTMINDALRRGSRGLPGDSTLTRLLAEHRPRRSRDLTRRKVLAWAAAHRAATGKWPNAKSGPVAGAPGETWHTIDQALRSGGRGFPGGSTLARLLGRPAGRPRPKLTLDLVRAWAAAHHAATRRWPSRHSGAIAGAPGENWQQIDSALRRGDRGLSSGMSLARLFGPERASSRPRLTIAQVMAWGKVHRATTGRWPTRLSGPIPGAPGAHWSMIDGALRHGYRGLPAGMSLARLFGLERASSRPRLTIAQVMAWGTAHRAATGRWPTYRSGPIRCAPGESWIMIESALRYGHRGLRAGTSLARLFKTDRASSRPRLTRAQVVAWGEAHRTATGEWPTRHSGPIPGAPGENWGAIYKAVYNGYRGLPAGTSWNDLFPRSGRRRASGHTSLKGPR